MAFAHAWKTKKLFNYVKLVGKYAFFLAKLVFCSLAENQSKEEELVKNKVFSLLAGRHQRVKTHLDIFWLQIQRKRSKEYLFTILAMKRKLWAIFFASSSSWANQANTGKLQGFFKIYISLCLPDSWFSETLYSQYLT